MRNKWYVIGVSVPAAALLWGTIHVLQTGGGAFALVPAGLAAGLIVVAVRVSRCESFAPAPPPERLQETGSAEMEKWKKHHAAGRAAKASAGKAQSSKSVGAQQR